MGLLLVAKPNLFCRYDFFNDLAEEIVIALDNDEPFNESEIVPAKQATGSFERVYEQEDMIDCDFSDISLEEGMFYVSTVQLFQMKKYGKPNVFVIADECFGNDENVDNLVEADNMEELRDAAELYDSDSSKENIPRNTRGKSANK